VARTLIAARVSVAPDHEAEYLRLAGELASLLGSRGEHLWVFRARDRSGVFLEFREARSSGRLPGEPATEAESGLDARLREIGHYTDGDLLWEEAAIGTLTEG
jgi:hypothetical protein